MELLLELLKKVPDEVWAAITASLMTLGGVYVSNLNNRKQQMEALKHDERQRDKEREMSLRREVFLQAVEAISSAQIALGRIINLNIDEQNISPDAQKNSAAISKLYIVATIPTVQAVSAYYKEFNSVFFELVSERSPLIERKNLIMDFSKLRDIFFNERQQLIELMKNDNLEGKIDERRRKVILENYEFADKKQKELGEKIEELIAVQEKERHSLIRHYLEKMSGIAPLIPPAVFAARQELELSLDEVDREAFLKIQNDIFAKTKIAAEDFLSEVQQRQGANTLKF